MVHAHHVGWVSTAQVQHAVIVILLAIHAVYQALLIVSHAIPVSILIHQLVARDVSMGNQAQMALLLILAPINV
jgi:hypothetical protein